MEEIWKDIKGCARNIRQVASKEPYNKKGSVRKQAGGFIWEDVED